MKLHWPDPLDFRNTGGPLIENKTLKANGFRPLFLCLIIARTSQIQASGTVPDGAARRCELSSRGRCSVGSSIRPIMRAKTRILLPWSLVEVYSFYIRLKLYTLPLYGYTRVRKEVLTKTYYQKKGLPNEDHRSYFRSCSCNFRRDCRHRFQSLCEGAAGCELQPSGHFVCDAGSCVWSIHLQYPRRQQLEVVDPPNVVGNLYFSR